MIRVYAKDQCNYIACEKLSSRQCFVCGCAWVTSQSSESEKYLLALDNYGQLSIYVLTIMKNSSVIIV